MKTLLTFINIFGVHMTQIAYFMILFIIVENNDD